MRTLVCPKCGHTHFHNETNHMKVDIDGHYFNGSAADENAYLSCDGCGATFPVVSAAYVGMKCHGKSTDEGLVLNTLEIMTVLIARFKTLVATLEDDPCLDLQSQFAELVRIFGHDRVHTAVMTMGLVGAYRLNPLYGGFRNDKVYAIAKEVMHRQVTMYDFLSRAFDFTTDAWYRIYVTVAEQWVKYGWHEQNNDQKENLP